MTGWEGNLSVARHPLEGWRGHLQLRLRDPQVVSHTHTPRYIYIGAETQIPPTYVHTCARGCSALCFASCIPSVRPVFDFVGPSSVSGNSGRGVTLLSAARWLRLTAGPFPSLLPLPLSLSLSFSRRLHPPSSLAKMEIATKEPNNPIAQVP